MDFSGFGFARFLKNLRMNIRRCLFCYETVFLVILLAISYIIAFAYGLKIVGVGVDNCWGWSLDVLFSLEAAKNAIEEAKGIWTIVPLGLYLITWLIGGGVLLAVFIEKTIFFRKQVSAGVFRYTKYLFGHYIILGWESNCITLLRDISEHHKSLFLFNFWTDRPRIIVLSECDADEIKRQVDASFKTGWFQKKPFKLVVYHGQYDSVEEIENLVINLSKYIFIVGELNEIAHDSRVLLLLARLNEKQIKLKCKAKIESHILYRSLRRMIERSEEHGFNTSFKVRFFNFYDNWARRILDGNDSYYSELNSFFNDDGDKEIIIVGFGKMGQSLALRAMRQSVHYYSKFFISAIDIAMDKLKPEFEAAFGDLNKRYEGTAEINLFESWSFESNEFITFLNNKIKSGKKVIVAITLSNPNEALESTLQILNNINDKTYVLVRQNINNTYIEQCQNIFKNCYNFPRVFFFGFQDGAGFGNIKYINKANYRRNPYSDMLLAYSHFVGRKLVKDINEKYNIKCKYRIGGSLWYDSALKNNYDIDLRLLVPGNWQTTEVRDHIKAIKDMLVEKAEQDGFKIQSNFIQEDGMNFIWHTKSFIDSICIPGARIVALTWNIQAESTYKGIAEMAAKLPREVIDKYVVAKWEAKQKSDEAYRALKKRWMKFIEWLIDNDHGKGMKALLEEAEKANKIPSFLK